MPTYPDLRNQAAVDRWLDSIGLDPEDLAGKSAAGRLRLAEEVVRNAIVLEEMAAMSDRQTEAEAIVHLPERQLLALAANPVVQGELIKQLPLCPAPATEQMFGREDLTAARRRRVWCLYNLGVQQRRKEKWDDWYHQVPETAVQALKPFGLSRLMNMYVRLLAVTSPRTFVLQNVRLASMILREFVHGRYLRVEGLMKTSFDAAVRVANAPYGEEFLTGVRGPKVEQFALALFGVKDAVAVDVWMMRAFGCETKEHKAPSNKVELPLIIQEVRRMARRYKVAPRDFQADVWIGVKIAEGKRKRDGRLVHTAEPLGYLVADVLPVVLKTQPREQFTFADEDTRTPWYE